MSITFSCNCGKEFTVKPDHAGKRTKCPDCGSGLLVPDIARAQAVEAEDQAFQMLTEWPEPAPSAHPNWQANREELPRPQASTPTVGPSRLAADAARESQRSYQLPRKPREREQRSGISISSGVIVGVLMMVGAVVWFLLGLAANRIFFYPPIMFVLGLVGFVRGLIGYEEE